MKRGRSFNFGLLYFVLLAGFLYLPIALLIVFSLNNSPLMIFPLKGLTLKWYYALWDATELLKAARNSIILGLITSAVATLLGTMAAIGVVRFRFRWRGAFLAVASMPLVIPYVVLAVALLILFGLLNVHLSLFTVGVGHVIICLPYVVLIVSARLAGFPSSLEEAAMDLGATYWGTLLRVTLPICFPAILAAFLTSFTTSFDEFAVSFFLAGTEPTLPVYLYSQLRFPNRLPIVVTLAAIVMVGSTVVLVLSEWLRRKGQPTARRGVV
ncbi:MAG: ABC transporter permease [Chloroflexi bacterium]|jgi:spermidine/putrescine transport system permease protein|nr:ABC transporter permease [Chloroflexota bacterium]